MCVWLLVLATGLLVVLEAVFFLFLRVRFGKGTGNDEKYVLRGKIMEMLLLLLVLPPLW